MIVAICGADGCGKTTVAEAVAKALDCEVIAFPNDAAFTGPAIRAYLRREWSVRLPGGTTGDYAETHTGALAFQALQIANRMELMPRLRRAKEHGYNLVLARYWQSAWVYGQLDGLPAEWLEWVHSEMVQPHVSILLDAPAEECMRRRAARDGTSAPERYEGKLDFTRRVVELYRALWAKDPGAAWRVVDATQSFANVVADAVEACGLAEALGVGAQKRGVR